MLIFHVLIAKMLPFELTYRVLRPVRPLNVRPCSPASLFPVSISSRTPPAPSNAPSRMSRSLLLLRLLQKKERGPNERVKVIFLSLPVHLLSAPELIAIINHVSLIANVLVLCERYPDMSGDTQQLYHCNSNTHIKVVDKWSRLKVISLSILCTL